MHVALDARKAYDGGIGRYIRCLTTALLDASPRLRLTLLMPRDMRAWLPAGERVARVDHDAGLYSVSELWRTAALVRTSGCDLFHAPHYVLSFPLPPRTIVTIHDVIHVTGPSPLERPIPRAYATWMIRTAARRAAHVLTVSEATKAAIVDFAGVVAERITAVPLGVEERFFTPPSPAEGPARALREGPPYCLYVGASKPHKNLPLLFRAFARARERLGAARLVTVTNPPPSLVDVAERLGLAGAWTNVPEMPEAALPALYAGARVTVVPSRVEGFGLPLLEAMAAGCPVVATRVASLPEVGGDVPFYVGVEDEEGLAEALVRLWSSEALRAERGRAGIARAMTFTWARTARATLAVYEAASRR